MILGIAPNARRPALSGGTATPPRTAAPTLSPRPVLRRAREPQQLCLDLQPRQAQTTLRRSPTQRS